MKLTQKHFENNYSCNLSFSVGVVPSLYTSAQYVVGGLVRCQFRAEVYDKTTPELTRIITVSEKFEIINSEMNVHPRIRSQFQGMSLSKRRNCYITEVIADDTIILINSIWHNKGTVTVKETKQTEDIISFTVTIIELLLSFTTPALFHGLYDDSTFTDFDLDGEDGSINVHKSVLAASSPVLSTMLSGQWKETAKGKVELAGITKETLKDLKAFIYLRKLPDPDEKNVESDEMSKRLEELLKLAFYLMMPDLIQACSAKLLLNVKSENAHRLMCLVGVYKLKTLMNGIMLSHNEGAIDISKFPSDWN